MGWATLEFILICDGFGRQNFDFETRNWNGKLDLWSWDLHKQLGRLLELMGNQL